jgi:hypothetical protein
MLNGRYTKREKSATVWQRGGRTKVISKDYQNGKITKEIILTV